MQQTIDKLKEKPKEQKTAVAGGIAVTVVVILLIGWGFFYLKKILAERPSDDIQTDAFDFASLRDSGDASGGDLSDDNFYDTRKDSSANPFGESRDNFDFE